MGEGVGSGGVATDVDSESAGGEMEGDRDGRRGGESGRGIIVLWLTFMLGSVGW